MNVFRVVEEVMLYDLTVMGEIILFQLSESKDSKTRIPRYLF